MGNRVQLSLIILAGTILIFASCRKENMGDCFKGTGDLVTVARDLPEFSNLEIADNVAVFLIQDSVNRCEVVAGENLTDLIITESDGERLLIENRNTCNFMRSYKVGVEVHLHFRNIDNITFRGSGDLRSVGTIRDSLIGIDCWGASGSVYLDLDVNVSYTALHTATADVTLKGKCPLFYPYSGGNGFIDASELSTRHTYLRNQGTGDMQVNATEVLVAEILHAGDVYYSGNPAVDSLITGKGRLIRVD